VELARLSVQHNAARPASPVGLNEEETTEDDSQCGREPAAKEALPSRVHSVSESVEALA
jgi:hypothetical protein